MVALAHSAGLVVSGSAGVQDAERVRGSGELPVPRFETAPLAQRADAFRRFAAGQTAGKLVLLP